MPLYLVLTKEEPKPEIIAFGQEKEPSIWEKIISAGQKTAQQYIEFLKTKEQISKSAWPLQPVYYPVQAQPTIPREVWYIAGGGLLLVALIMLLGK